VVLARPRGASDVDAAASALVAGRVDVVDDKVQIAATCGVATASGGLALRDAPDGGKLARVHVYDLRRDRGRDDGRGERERHPALRLAAEDADGDEDVQAPIRHVSRAAPRKTRSTRMRHVAAAASVTAAVKPMSIALAVECPNANVVTTMKPPARASASMR
jgi:hypothetical protein